MARPPERFVAPLSDQETQALKETWKDSDNHRERCRAHAILLSSEGMCVSDLADVFQVTCQTIRSWLDRWESDGDLEDAPRSGAPPKLSPDQQELAIEELEQSPHNPQGVVERIEQKTGVSISMDLLGRLAKKFGMAWKRVRGSLRDRRDEAAFSAAQNDIREFAHLHESRELSLWFFDEASFSLTPSVPYAWQRIGETIEMPFQRGTSVSALGFVSPDSEFHAFEFTGTITTAVVTEVMNQFCDKVTGENVVVLDNAPVHRSAAFKSCLANWRDQGVYPYFLPAYSPELNLIEIVWKKIKHQFLPLSAYRSAQDLWDELGYVLAAIGNELKVNFTLPQFA